MAVTDGQRADQQTFNDAFLSRTVDSDTVAIVGLNHDDLVSGPAIPDTQLKINDNADRITQNETDIVTLFATKQDISEKDQPNGYAGLDANSKIAASALPFEAVEFKGAWDASTNTPTLANGTGDIGDIYRVNVAGSQDLGAGSENYAVGDWVTYNGTVWERSDFVGAGVLDDLSDVDTNQNLPLTDNHVIGYDTNTSQWISKISVAQENLAWVPQGTGSWDGTTFDFVLSDDCFVSVPPLPNSYHTIQAQTINFANDGDVAYVTIDRAAAATTNLTVNVTPIASFVNDGSNIIIGRRLGTELFVGIHDPQRFQDGDEFDLSKGGGGFTGVREANTFDLKPLTSNITNLNTTLGAMTHTVEIGKKYSIRGMFAANITSGTDNLTLSVTHDGNILCQPALTLGFSGSFGSIGFETDVFTATATTVTFVTASVGPNTTILGNGTTGQSTWSSIELHNDLDTNLVANNDLILKTMSMVASHDGGQSFSSGVNTVLIYEVEERDTNSTYNPVTGVWTCPKDGWYELHAQTGFSGLTAGTGDVQVLFSDPSITSFYGFSRSPIENSTQSFDLKRDLFFSQGDEVVVVINQQNGANRSTSALNTFHQWSIKSNPDFSSYGVVNPESEYLETIYADGTGDISSPTVYVSPGPSAFELTLQPGTWDIGYALTMVMESLGGTGQPIAKFALHQDGVLLEETTTMISHYVNNTSDGAYLPATNTTRITIASAATISLRIQAFTPASIRNRMASITWTGAIGPGGEADSSPKIWARRVS